MDINLVTLSQLPKDNPSNDYKLVGGKVSENLTTVTVEQLASFLSANTNTMLKKDYADMSEGSPSANKVASAANADRLAGLIIGDSVNNIPTYNEDGNLTTSNAKKDNACVNLLQLKEVIALIAQKVDQSLITTTLNATEEKIPTVGAVSQIANRYRGEYSIIDNGGKYPTEGGSGLNAKIRTGDFWITKEDGSIGSITARKGTILIAKKDNPNAFLDEDWGINLSNEDYLAEDKSKKTFTLKDATHDSYPSSRAVQDALDGLFTSKWEEFILPTGYKAEIALVRKKTYELNFELKNFEITEEALPPYAISLKPTADGDTYGTTSFDALFTGEGYTLSPPITKKMIIHEGKAHFHGFQIGEKYTFSGIVPIVPFRLVNPRIMVTKVGQNSITINAILGQLGSTYSVYVNNTLISQNNTSSEFTINSLSPGTQYSVKIIENISVNSLPSNTLLVVTLPAVTKENFAFFTSKSVKIVNKTNGVIGVKYTLIGDGGKLKLLGNLPYGEYTASAGGGGYYQFNGYFNISPGIYYYLINTGTGYYWSIPNDQTTRHRYVNNGGDSDGINHGGGGTSSNSAKYGEDGEDSSIISGIFSQKIGGRNGNLVDNGYGRGADGVFISGRVDGEILGQEGGIGIKLAEPYEVDSVKFYELFDVLYL